MVSSAAVVIGVFLSFFFFFGGGGGGGWRGCCGGCVCQDETYWHKMSLSNLLAHIILSYCHGASFYEIWFYRTLQCTGYDVTLSSLMIHLGLHC